MLLMMRKNVSPIYRHRNEKSTWLTYLIIAFLIWKAIFLTYYLAFLFTKENHVYFQIFVEVTFLFYAALIMYKSLQFPYVMLEPVNSAKYKTSPLSGGEKANYRSLIEAYMSESKVFLNPDFNLKHLSEAISIPKHHLSQVFSEEMNKRFPEYLNHLRIEYALRLMADSHFVNRNILEIMYEAGFNSKSVFNKVFKNYTGMTPRDYRNRDQLQLN